MIDRETEFRQLNPTVPYAIGQLAAETIRWSEAPTLAAAWIGFHGKPQRVELGTFHGVPITGVDRLDDGMRAVWVLDDGRDSRVPAPVFDVRGIPEGGTLIVRRPGWEWDPWIIGWLHNELVSTAGLLGWIRKLPGQMEAMGMELSDEAASVLFPRITPGYRRPAYLHPEPLSFAVQVALVDTVEVGLNEVLHAREVQATWDSCRTVS